MVNLESLGKPEACGQKMLLDMRQVKIYIKIENETIFDDFQTLCSN